MRYGVHSINECVRSYNKTKQEVYYYKIPLYFMHNNIHAGIVYILYFTLESKMIIVGLHIITSRHVFNNNILLKYMYAYF